jgi:hypothetical protein
VKVRERMLHDVLVPMGAGRNVRVLVVEKTRSTVKARYVSYQYYVARGSQRATISRHAAVLLGVRV